MTLSALKDRTIAFIGGGHMAEALLGGLLSGGWCEPGQLTATDIREERLEELRVRFGIRALADNARAFREADVAVLAVKPQQLDGVLKALKGARDPSRGPVLSLAAGKTTSWIESRLDPGTRVLRAMPNTPALVGAGITALCAGALAGEEDLHLAESILRAVGAVVRVSEDLLNAVTAVSGSGPAYILLWIEALEAAALRLGLPADLARELVLATVSGTAALCRQTGTAPSALRAQVTSKGGTTAAALAVLTERGAREALEEAVAAACHRAEELSREGA